MHTDKNLTFHIKNQVLELVYVEGTDENGFEMGDERTPHRVRLSSYWIGKYPVTQGLYEAVMSINPSRFQGDENRPVERVSWHDIMGESGDGTAAACFIFHLHKALNDNPKNKQAFEKAAQILREEKKEGEKVKKEVKFTLPSEAQWEYAARGGKEEWQQGYLYAGSNEIHEVAWYGENSHRETKPVGLKKPIGLGLYDMSGNVLEWCMDYYDREYYKKCDVKPPLLNPVNLVSGSSRVIRGGSWNNGRENVRLTYRYILTPTIQFNYLGFRICLA